MATSFSSVLLISCVLLLASCTCCNGDNVPRFFIFGDSLVDSGNNNYIFTIAKANTMPNGVDFVPAGHNPTGRFCNGKTVPDLLVDQFPAAACYPPPYMGAETKDAAVKCGLNYASGGAGIFNHTGYIFIGRINMDAQVDNYASTRQDLIESIGSEKATELLQNAYFPIIMGSNDFLDNFLVPIFGSRKVIPPDVFIEHLIARFRDQITRLYSLDARRFLVVNIGPIGCIPYQVGISGGKCAEESNQLARNFNEKLKELVINELTPKLPQTLLVYANIYKTVDEILKNYASYGRMNFYRYPINIWLNSIESMKSKLVIAGFEVNDIGCCKVEGELSVLLPCGERSTFCSDRSKYVFWDPFHPTEAANKIIADKLLNGGPEYIYPMNIMQAKKMFRN